MIYGIAESMLLLKQFFSPLLGLSLNAYSSIVVTRTPSPFEVDVIIHESQGY